MPFQCRNLRLDLPRMPNVVGIEKGDKLPTGVPNAEVACRGNSRVRLSHISHARPICFSQLPRVVGGSIVRDYHLHITVGLCERTLDRASDDVCTVVSGNDYTHKT